jgi:hypothetical protein
MRCSAIFQLATAARAAATVYEQALQRIAIMDKTGYDAMWLAEYHFTRL